MDDVIRQMLKWSVLAAVICTTLFILQYTAYSPWWRDKVARMVVFRDLTTLLALVPFVGALFFHLTAAESEIAAWVYTVSIMMVSVIMVSCMVIWHQVNRDGGLGQESPALLWVKAAVRKIRFRRPAPPGESALPSFQGMRLQTRRQTVNVTVPRALNVSTNPAGWMAAAGAVFAAATMIYNAVNHHGVIDTGVIIAAVGAVGAMLTRQVVTPVADPKNGAGVPLVPVPPAVPALPPGVSVIPVAAPGVTGSATA